MGVALAKGSSTDEARQKATTAANQVELTEINFS
jgi:formate-dependent phosphoribosylglycinamide formyltransferase (GAR transformylase)